MQPPISLYPNAIPSSQVYVRLQWPILLGCPALFTYRCNFLGKLTIMTNQLTVPQRISALSHDSERNDIAGVTCSLRCIYQMSQTIQNKYRHNLEQTITDPVYKFINFHITTDCIVLGPRAPQNTKGHLFTVLVHVLPSLIT